MADLQQLLQLSQQMQGRLAQFQTELVGRTVTATAGGGMVRVTVDGRGLLRALDIDPAAFEGRDAELLSDLVLSAVAEAQRQAADLVQGEMRKLPFPGVPPAATP